MTIVFPIIELSYVYLTGAGETTSRRVSTDSVDIQILGKSIN